MGATCGPDVRRSFLDPWRVAVSERHIRTHAKGRCDSRPVITSHDRSIFGDPFQRTMNTEQTGGGKERTFTRYQVFLIAVLAFMQFTVILDFMVISPLGAILMPVLHITPKEFSHAVMGYAIAAGLSGLLAAGFADRYDRKKLLLFFYTGFIAGTLLCALAPTYPLLLAARIITGVFGGVVGSVSMAIVTDAFHMQVRGRVMGYIQMAFAVSQVAGIPFGLFLANHFDWHAPFMLIVLFGGLAGLVIFRFMRPVTEHLHLHGDRHPVRHLWATFTNKQHRLSFITMMILATGGFMMMPFSTAFVVNNIGIAPELLPRIYLIMGLFSFFSFPLAGRLSDRLGRVPTFLIGTVIALTMVVIYTHMGPSPLWLVVAINVVMFVGIGSRIVSSSALMTAVPDLKDRGAFMSINSSIQQLCGGIAAWIAGLIVVQTSETAPLQRYDVLGFACCGSMIVCAALIYLVDRQLRSRTGHLEPMVPAR